MGQGLVVLQLVKICEVLQRCFLFGLCRGIQLLPGLGAAVVVIQPHQVGVDDPQAGQCLGDVLLIGQGDM